MVMSAYHAAMASLKRADLPMEVLDLITHVPLPDPAHEPAGRESIRMWDPRFLAPVRDAAADLAVFARLARRFHLAAQARLDSIVIVDAPAAIDAAVRRFAARRGVNEALRRVEAVRYFYIGARCFFEASERQKEDLWHLLKTCNSLHTFVSATSFDGRPLARSCRVVVTLGGLDGALANVDRLDAYIALVGHSTSADRVLELAMRCSTLGLHCYDFWTGNWLDDGTLDATTLMLTRGESRHPVFDTVMPIVTTRFPRLQAMRIVELQADDVAHAVLSMLPVGLTSLSATWHTSVARSDISRALVAVNKAVRAGVLPHELRSLRFTMSAAPTLLSDDNGATSAARAAAERAAIGPFRDNAIALVKTCEACGIALELVTIAHIPVGSGWRGVMSKFVDS